MVQQQLNPLTAGATRAGAATLIFFLVTYAGASSFTSGGGSTTMPGEAPSSVPARTTGSFHMCLHVPPEASQKNENRYFYHQELEPVDDDVEEDKSTELPSATLAILSSTEVELELPKSPFGLSEPRFDVGLVGPRKGWIYSKTIAQQDHEDSESDCPPLMMAQWL